MRVVPSLTGLLMLASSALQAAEPAARLLHNGKVYTVNEQQPWASALAIAEDGRILAVGDGQALQAYVDAQTERVDLQGRLVLPGFQDTHAHVLDASSQAQGDCTLSPGDGVERWLEQLEECNAEDEGDWLVGWGFALHSLLEEDEAPRDLLDAVVADRPVTLMEETSHAYWLNSRAWNWPASMPTAPTRSAV
ncbi:amidohydrolase family protein [Pseudomonas lalucatii]|nr:amidohydrolase family protein [Pseudomonas lalucatii]